MTLSSDQRRREIEEALAAMLHELGDAGLDEYVVDPSREVFTSLHRTTWDELVRLGWATSLGHVSLYRLTGAGWLEALRSGGRLQSSELREQATSLVKALKRRVKGRLEDGVATVHDFEAEGLGRSFVFNAIESRLLPELFPGRRYEVEWKGDPWNSGAALFKIPRDFALEDLD